MEPADEIDSPVDSFETGTLAIKSGQTTGIVTDLWQRPTRRLTPTDGPTSVWFEIPYARIMPTEVADTNNATKKYVVYDVTVKRAINPSDDIEPAMIERRYTHFRDLYDCLKRVHGAAMTQMVLFPKKVLMGNFSADLIAERSAAFEAFLDFVVGNVALRETEFFLRFLQESELARACQLLDERRNEQAVPILENCFRIVNKIFLDRSKPVLLLLCRIVAACTTSPLPHPAAEKWAELALRRYDSVCDADLLVLYVPLLQTCVHLWWQRGRDNKFLEDRLSTLTRKGMKVKNGPTLTQAIHALEPRAETT